MNTASHTETAAPHGVIVAAYAFCMVMLFPTLVVASKGVAVVFAVLTLVSLVDFVWRGAYRRMRLSAELGLYVALIAFALLSALWSIDPNLSIRSALHQALYPLGLFLTLSTVRRFDPSSARRVIVALGIGLAVTAVIVLFEWATDFVLAKALRGITPEILPSVNIHALLNTGWSGSAILVWPLVAFAFVRRRRVLGGAMFAGVCLAASLGDSAAALLALGVSAALFLILSVWKSPVLPALLGAAFAVFLFATPFGAQQIDRTEVSGIPLGHWLQDWPHSTYHRFLIMSFAGERIAERPWTGYGMNSSRVMPGGSEVVHGWREKVFVGADGEASTKRAETFNANVLPLHPHNISLQLWLELGPVAALLVALLVGAVVRRCQAIPVPAIRAGALASLGAWMISSVLSFGVWQHWWVSLAVITAMVWMVMARAVEAEDAAVEN